MARNEYLDKHKKQGTELKVFLYGGAMLSGRVTDFDEECIVLNKCLIERDKIISITPQ